MRYKEKGIRAEYSGESSRSGYSRGIWHQNDLKNMKPGTPLSDHQSIHHPDITMVPTDFNMEVRKSFKRPMPRIVAEKVDIEKWVEEKQKCDSSIIILNSKLNFYKPKIIKVNARLEELD